MSDLYKHPEEYDREHLGDEEDVGFYLSLSRRLAPRKVLEVGCGTGRITLPLAQIGFDLVGLDNQPEMLQKAEERRLQAPSEIRQRIQFIEGDMRTWSDGSDFDLILIPASSITHVLGWKTSSRYGKLVTIIFAREDGYWSKSRCPIWLRLRIPSVSRPQ
jgi:2-polyprenyl-3-methyl-5-hydroxy-6-metoxy-1,4-benzoquinol methylase